MEKKKYPPENKQSKKKSKKKKSKVKNKDNKKCPSNSLLKHKKAEEKIEGIETKNKNEQKNSKTTEKSESKQQNEIVKSKSKENCENNLEEKIEKKGGKELTPVINTDLTEEEKSTIAENIIKELELDKLILLKEEKKKLFLI